jgi:hypothetical protein
LHRSKAVDDVSCAQIVNNDNQDHLFSKMTSYNSYSFYFQSSVNTPILEDKHFVFSSSSLFQLAVKNVAKYLWIIDTGATDILFVLFLSSLQLPQLFLRKSNYQTVILLLLHILAMLRFLRL